jgi:hypothetical protein
MNMHSRVRKGVGRAGTAKTFVMATWARRHLNEIRAFWWSFGENGPVDAFFDAVAASLGAANPAISNRRG